MTTSKTTSLPRPDAPRPALRLVERLDDPDSVESGLQIRVRAGSGTDGVALVALVGENDRLTASRLESSLRRLIEKGISYIVVDLDEVTSVDADALRDLIDATRDAADAGAVLLVTTEPRLMLMLKVRPVTG